MVNPVSGDKVLSQGSGRSNGLEERRAERQQQDTGSNGGGNTKAGVAVYNSVQVSRAGELFSRAAAPVRRSEEAVESAAEAEALARRILQQFEQSPAQALKAQAGERVDQYAYLLQTAPVT